MGGGHRDVARDVAHDAAHYEGYPKGVWSPTGGWWSDHKYWRRNTALALAGIFLVCIPIAMTSARLEVIFCLFHIMLFSVLGFGADVSRRACFRVWFCRCETGSSISEDFAFCGGLDPPVQQESTLVFSFGSVTVFVAYRHNERDACI